MAGWAGGVPTDTATTGLATAALLGAGASIEIQIGTLFCIRMQKTITYKYHGGNKFIELDTLKRCLGLTGSCTLTFGPID
jgi:hypothetical protein